MGNRVRKNNNYNMQTLKIARCSIALKAEQSGDIRVAHKPQSRVVRSTPQIPSLAEIIELDEKIK